MRRERFERPFLASLYHNTYCIAFVVGGEASFDYGKASAAATADLLETFLDVQKEESACKANFFRSHSLVVGAHPSTRGLFIGSGSGWPRP
jgi:hypothetical protein